MRMINTKGRLRPKSVNQISHRERSLLPKLDVCICLSSLAEVSRLTSPSITCLHQVGSASIHDRISAIPIGRVIMKIELHSRSGEVCPT